MHFLLAGKVLLSLETQTEMSMEYDSTECEFWCQIAKVRSTEQFVGLTCCTTRHAFVGKCPWLCLHRATGIFARICDDCHDDELRRSEECVSRCAARAGAEPQRQRKPGNPANHVAFKAGNKLKRQRKSSNTRKTDAFPGPKGAQKHHPPQKPHKKEENNMRLDKYLKVSRLIKRRPVANEACDAGRILVNDKVAKASLNVKPGDVIEIQFGDKTTKVEVLRVEETYKKDEAKELYKYL